MIDELNGDFLQWLRGFYYVATSGSIRRAAQLMNRNPSTISYQLRSLEQELNTVLFDRYKKSLNITPEGKKLLEWTVSMFETLKGMRSDVATVRGQLQGTVTLSSTLPFATQLVGALTAFRNRHPDVNIKLRRVLTSGVVDDVESSRVDFGLAGITAMPENSEFEELFQARPMLVVRKGNSYGLPPKPGPDDLAHLPMVSFLSEQLDNTGDPFFGSTMAASPYAGNSVLSVNNYHLMLRFVMQGVGAAIMDEMSLKGSLFGAEWKALVRYPLDSFLPVVSYGILVRRRKHLSPQARALMDDIREALSREDLTEHSADPA